MQYGVFSEISGPSTQFSSVLFTKDLLDLVVSLLGEGVTRAELLDAQPSQPLTNVDRLVEALALDKTGNETTSKCITGTVGVVDLLLSDGMNRVSLNLLATLLGNDSRLSTLGNNGETGTLGVLLGQVGEVLGNGSNVGLSDPQVVRLGISGSLGLVADHVVPVLGGLVKGFFEELGNERGGKVDNEDLVVGGSLLPKGEDGIGANGEVVTTNVVELSTLDELPDVLSLQVLQVVMVGGTEIRAQASVVAGNDHTASTGGDLGVDSVLDSKTNLLDGITEGGGVLVVTDTTKVHDAVLGQDVLSTAGGVLSGTTSNQLGIVVVQQVLVKRSVLLLGKDGIIVLETVLLQQSLVASCLDIWGAYVSDLSIFL